MAILVVGGDGRGTGKTSLICGLLRALPEYRWTAVKVTSHEHGAVEPIREECEAVAGPDEQGTDTARYLAAGARRALLLTAHADTLGSLAKKIVAACGPGENVIFESNSVLKVLRPDLCLAVASNLSGGRKPSFELVEQCMDASVALGGHDHVIEGERLHFHLRSLGRVSPTMCAWLRERLSSYRPIVTPA